MNGIRGTTVSNSISHGTLRQEDLIPTFTATLKLLAPEPTIREADLIAEAEGWADTPADLLDSALHAENGGYILNELTDALDNLAPEGFYFGAHEGDGSDFGFWRIEPDEKQEP
jgi:hypothetical protein